MRTLKSVWKGMFDLREGELARTLLMALYLLAVMFAYYILKPVSRAMFLTEFKVDRLPYLNMLIAAGGGVLAYLYSKFAARASLQAAVAWAMGVSATCLAAFWWLVWPEAAVDALRVQRLGQPVQRGAGFTRLAGGRQPLARAVLPPDRPHSIRPPRLCR